MFIFSGFTKLFQRANETYHDVGNVLKDNFNEIVQIGPGGRGRENQKSDEDYEEEEEDDYEDDDEFDYFYDDEEDSDEEDYYEEEEEYSDNDMYYQEGEGKIIYLF